MTDSITRDAGLSADQRYRYWLSRRWGHQDHGYLLWIMLNPSTADALKDDATIRKCMGFAKRMGYECIVVVNLYPSSAESRGRCPGMNAVRRSL